MAGAIGVAAVLRARMVNIRCPHCGHIKRVERKPAARRVCPRCRRQFPDPLTVPAKR
jgi:transposase-like protein